MGSCSVVSYLSGAPDGHFGGVCLKYVYLTIHGLYFFRAPRPMNLQQESERLRVDDRHSNPYFYALAVMILTFRHFVP
jgi:hypothetical protein